MNRINLFVLFALATLASISSIQAYAQSSAPTLIGQNYICAARHESLTCPSNRQGLLYPKEFQTKYRSAKIYSDKHVFSHFFSTSYEAKAFNANRAAKNNFIRYVMLDTSGVCIPKPRAVFYEAYRDSPPVGLTPAQNQLIKDVDKRVTDKFDEDKNSAQIDCLNTFKDGNPEPTFGPKKDRATHGGEAIYDSASKKFVSSKGTNAEFLIDADISWYSAESGEPPFGYKHFFKADEKTLDLVYSYERYFLMLCCGPSGSENPNNY